MRAIQLFVCAWIFLVVSSCSSSFQPLTGEEGWAIEDHPTFYEKGISKGNGPDGSDALVIRSMKGEDITATDMGSLSRSIEAGPWLGKRIRLSCLVKTNEVKEGAGLWMRVFDTEYSLAFDWMENRMVKGNVEWQPCSVVLEVPAEATHIGYGAWLQGKGEVCLGELKVEEVGKDIALTGTIKKERFPEVPQEKTCFNGYGFVLTHNKVAYINHVSEQIQKKQRSTASHQTP